MKSEIRINNTAGACHIDIEGTIGVPESRQFDNPEDRVATYDKFRETVQRIGAIRPKRAVVNIRSTGGDVNDALLIHDALLQTGAHITTRCYGYTASAATIIAQAAAQGCREISANALYLIHTSVCATEGNATELAAKSELLRQTDGRIAAIYAARSGRGAEHFISLMGENNGGGRWLSPEQAVAAGLADGVIDAALEPSDPAGEPSEAAQEPSEAAPELTLSHNLARGWRRLMAGVGLKAGDTEPAAGPKPCGALHSEERERPLRRLSAADEFRRRISPTRTLPREDPSFNEPLHTTNERAYTCDAKQFRKQ